MNVYVDHSTPGIDSNLQTTESRSQQPYMYMGPVPTVMASETCAAAGCSLNEYARMWMQARYDISSVMIC